MAGARAALRARLGLSPASSSRRCRVRRLRLPAAPPRRSDSLPSRTRGGRPAALLRPGRPPQTHSLLLPLVRGSHFPPAARELPQPGEAGWHLETPPPPTSPSRRSADLAACPGWRRRVSFHPAPLRSGVPGPLGSQRFAVSRLPCCWSRLGQRRDTGSSAASPGRALGGLIKAGESLGTQLPKRSPTCWRPVGTHPRRGLDACLLQDVALCPMMAGAELPAGAGTAGGGS